MNADILNTGNDTTTLAERNKVLRNTYGLLSLSLIPTIFGAWLGSALNFSPMIEGRPFVSFMLFMAVAFGFFYAIEKTKNSGWGIAILLVFTLFMGLMMTGLITRTLRFSNGPQLIALAFGATATIFFGMAMLANTIKRDLSGMGKFLFIGAVMLLVAIVANIFLQLPALSIAISVIAIGIFSAYMLYDIKQIIDGGETNYITATLSLYLDIYNVFANLLSLLGIFGGDRD
jgi:modulator of FtsH protease